MTRIIFLSLIAAFSAATSAQAMQMHIASCTRVTRDAEYQIEIYRIGHWKPVLTNPGNNNARVLVSVVRTKNGSKSVRNYDDSMMHQRLGATYDVAIPLSRQNGHISYGEIKFNFLRRHGQVQKIKNAIIDLSTADEEKELDLECEPTENFDTV